jgi:hypothetical protein
VNVANVDKVACQAEGVLVNIRQGELTEVPIDSEKGIERKDVHVLCELIQNELKTFHW